MKGSKDNDWFIWILIIILIILFIVLSGKLRIML